MQREAHNSLESGVAANIYGDIGAWLWKQDDCNSQLWSNLVPDLQQGIEVARISRVLNSDGEGTLALSLVWVLRVHPFAACSMQHA